MWERAGMLIGRLHRHVGVVARWDDADRMREWLAPAIAANPSTLFDCYLLADAPPPPEQLREWRAALPYAPGYLDRVAVYRRPAPGPEHDRISPRVWLVLPWSAQVEPKDYLDVAGIVWAYDLAESEEPPFAAWAGAGGAGVWVRGRPAGEIARWREQTETRLWAG